MRYIRIAEIGEIADGGKKKITLDGKVLLAAKIDGNYYVIDNKCPHMGGSLYDGNLEGYNIICPRHGSVFDIRTGEAVKGGKMAFINVKPGKAKPYPVKIEGNDLLAGIE